MEIVKYSEKLRHFKMPPHCGKCGKCGFFSESLGIYGNLSNKISTTGFLGNTLPIVDNVDRSDS
ncbi:MAG: hypothetical protein K6F84_08250 [Lachnospiraceae bacterium]|nr:hypothetical protein [Lachnospiraceae bacterium]